MKRRQVAALLAAAALTGSGYAPAGLQAAAFAEEIVDDAAMQATDSSASENADAQQAAETAPAEDTTAAEAAEDYDLAEAADEELFEPEEDSTVAETAVKAEKETEKGKADSGDEDPDGLIEDTGEVVSVYEGSSIEELMEEELIAQGLSVFPGFTVDPWKYPAVNITKNTQAIYWFLREEMELNHAAACGVLANIQLEANFRPIALGDGGTSYGICQWHLGRFTRLMAYCQSKDLDYNTLEGQLAYLKFELENYFPQVLGGLKMVEDSAKGAYSAGYLFCYQFEIPDQTAARSQQRGNLAQFEYFRQEFDHPEEEKDEDDEEKKDAGFAQLVVLREVTRKDKKDAEDETEDAPEAPLDEDGNMIVLPEDFQINLFGF